LNRVRVEGAGGGVEFCLASGGVIEIDI
jgi:hypothetical protein